MSKRDSYLLSISVILIILLTMGYAQAGCMPGRNICNVLGESIARAFDAQQARIYELVAQQEGFMIRQFSLAEQQNKEIQRQNDIQEIWGAYVKEKDKEISKQERLANGTADFYEDENDVYCAWHGRCYSEALKEKWKRIHNQ